MTAADPAAVGSAAGERRTTGPSRRRRGSPAAWLAAAFTLLAICWVVANPIGTAPDEPAQYVRALAVAEGQLFGHPAAFPTTGLTSAQIQLFDEEVGAFTVSGRLLPAPHDACTDGRPDVPASCQAGPAPHVLGVVHASTYIAKYPPESFLLPGLVAGVAPDGYTGILFARLGMLAENALLILLGAACFGIRRSPVLAAAFVLAVTPMVVFIASAVNASGVEICSGLCFTMGLIALTRPEPARRIAWLALAIGGALLLTTRATGPVWAACLSTLPVLLLGPRAIVRRIRHGGTTAIAALALLTAAAVAAVAWDVAIHGHTTGTVGSVSQETLQQLKTFPEQLQEMIGVFGSLDSWMPSSAYVGWFALVAIIGFLALWLGDWRQRLTLVVASALIVVADIWLDVWILAPTGYPVQGRYLLPIAAAPILLSGEIIRTKLHARIPRRLMSAGILCTIALAGVLQVVGWYFNGRRYAVGQSGPLLFFRKPQWVPPGGWAVWLAISAAALVAFLLAAAGFARPPSSGVAVAPHDAGNGRGMREVTALP